MEQEAGFKLDGEFYPWADHYDMTTCVYIEQVTGTAFADFAEMVDVEEDEVPSYTVLLGMMVAAVHQRYPNWSVRKLKKLLAVDVGSSAFEILGGNEDVEEEPMAEVVQLPPVEGGDLSPPSLPKSTDEPGPPDSAETPQSDSGEQTSDTSTA